MRRWSGGPTKSSNEGIWDHKILEHNERGTALKTGKEKRQFKLAQDISPPPYDLYKGGEMESVLHEPTRNTPLKLNIINYGRYINLYPYRNTIVCYLWLQLVKGAICGAVLFVGEVARNRKWERQRGRSEHANSGLKLRPEQLQSPQISLQHLLNCNGTIINYTWAWVSAKTSLLSKI